MDPVHDENFVGILADTEEFVDATVGLFESVDRGGRFFIEKDYRIKGEVWRVHKTDADPYPSNPHAHCVGGAQRYVGLTLHLGTRELYSGREPLGKFLSPKSFDRLIAMIRPKFPDIELPLPLS